MGFEYCGEVIKENDRAYQPKTSKTMRACDGWEPNWRLGICSAPDPHLQLSPEVQVRGNAEMWEHCGNELGHCCGTSMLMEILPIGAVQ